MYVAIKAVCVKASLMSMWTEVAEERKAVQLSSDRLRESHCRWRDCDAILESTERLGRHAQQHVWDSELVIKDRTSIVGMFLTFSSAQAPFICEWQDCGRQYSTREKLKDHLIPHAESSLICAFAGK